MKKRKKMFSLKFWELEDRINPISQNLMCKTIAFRIYKSIYYISASPLMTVDLEIPLVNKYITEN